MSRVKEIFGSSMKDKKLGDIVADVNFKSAIAFALILIVFLLAFIAFRK